MGRRCWDTERERGMSIKRAWGDVEVGGERWRTAEGGLGGMEGC